MTESNYYFFGGPDMTQADVKAKEDAIEKLTTKADIVQALKDSLQGPCLRRRHHPRERLCHHDQRHYASEWPPSDSPT